MDGSSRTGVGAIVRNHLVSIRDSLLLFSGLPVEEICNMFTFLACTSCSFVPREINRVAHSLARMAISIYDDRVWLIECPSFVRNIVSADI
ncbi:hypothetical protein Q3G72_003361 [Acer saccharum]|nr:hypothetical protein Q3G72_003361 [Acer saccharum]